ncbi:6-bladed beta-propeller [Parabacteroides sp. OttesenSCG-928-K15]|nr:6-bladed beta-propeller [Parabacteroides sp. OttesenSCG-928-K15]
MKKNSCFPLIVSLVMIYLFAACAGNNKTTSDNDLYVIDIQKNYPTKKMKLQDIAEVEYLQLETTDDLLWQGPVSAFADNYIINMYVTNGDILLFDRKGKALRRINRQGNSGEEYSQYSTVLLDEENKELFVNDPRKRKLFVYDLEGNFKRVANLPEGHNYSKVENFDRTRLIVYNNVWEKEKPNVYYLLSKSTGEIEKEIIIPHEGEKLSAMQTVERNGNRVMFAFRTYDISTACSEMTLNDLSNDTTFTINSSAELKPFVVQSSARASLDPELFMYCSMESRDYLFLYTVEKYFVEGSRDFFTQKHLMYDKKEGKVYEQDLSNDDFEREAPFHISPQTTSFSPTNRNVYVTPLQAADLLDAYANNQLKGRLKEIAATLDEEDNPVLMIVRMKR